MTLPPGSVQNLEMDSSGKLCASILGGASSVNVTVVSSALPAGAATAANQTNGSQQTQLVDNLGNIIHSTSNNLNVQCANCTGSGASAVDEASFTAGSSVFAPSGVFFQSSPTSNALLNGQQGMLQGTANRAAFVNLRDASANELGIAASPLQVSLANTGANGTAVSVSAAQSGTWNINNISGAISLPTGAAKDSSLTTINTTLGSPFQAGGSIGNTTFASTQGTSPWVDNISQFGGNAVATGTGASGLGIPRVTVSSDSAVEITDSKGNSLTSTGGALDVNIKTTAVEGTPTDAPWSGVGPGSLSAIAKAEVVNMLNGQQRVQVNGNVSTVAVAAPTAIRSAGSATDTTAITVLAAKPGFKGYLTSVQCGRNDAGTTAITVTLNDTASTVMIVPNSGGGGGNNMVFQTPLVSTGTNTAITAANSGSTSTLYCNGQGYYAP